MLGDPPGNRILRLRPGGGSPVKEVRYDTSLNRYRGLPHHSAYADIPRGRCPQGISFRSPLPSPITCGDRTASGGSEPLEAEEVTHHWRTPADALSGTVFPGTISLAFSEAVL